MRSRPSFTVLLLVLGLGTAETGETLLFNGKDLSGWSYFLEKQGRNADGSLRKEDVWTVRDGVLRCSGEPRGYLRTETQHRNYLLTVEWRWPEKPANSGVLLRVVGPDKLWPRAIEAQLKSESAGDMILMDGARLDSAPAHTDPANPRRRPKSKMAEKPPGEWNTYRITVDGGRIALEVNGERLNEGTGAEEIAGAIALQSEGGPIEFRTVKLTPIGD